MQPRPETGETAVLLCGCGGKVLGREASEALVSRLEFAGIPPSHILVTDALCAPAGQEAVRRFVTKRGVRKLVCAGCSPATNAEVLRRLAAASGLQASALFGVRLRGRADEDAREIRKATRALAGLPAFQSREIRLEPRVLVLGRGQPALRAATRLAELGHPVTMAATDVEAAHDGAGITVASGALLRLDGQVGGFCAEIGAGSERSVVSCGAVVVADGLTERSFSHEPRLDGRTVVSLETLEEALGGLRRENRVRPVGIVLDLQIEESKGSSERALETARRLQRDGACQVFLFAHDVRVGAPGLQELYDEVRGTGVLIVKYDGLLELSPSPVLGAQIRCRDAGLGAEASYACDLVAISSGGLRPHPDQERASRELAEILGVGMDPSGRLQQNNIHLLPMLSSRLGIFVAGACRGQDYLRDAILEAEAAAAAAHGLLAPGTLTVELSQPVVDEEKCALCLTCVRACPHRAMGWNQEKKVAEASAEACRRCGICAGECPAKAISLPAYADEAVLAQLGMHARPAAAAGRSHG